VSMDEGQCTPSMQEQSSAVGRRVGSEVGDTRPGVGKKVEGEAEGGRDETCGGAEQETEAAPKV
jgi:hypothetical protein